MRGDTSLRRSWRIWASLASFWRYAFLIHASSCLTASDNAKEPKAAVPGHVAQLGHGGGPARLGAAASARDARRGVGGVSAQGGAGPGRARGGAQARGRGQVHTGPAQHPVAQRNGGSREHQYGLAHGEAAVTGLERVWIARLIPRQRFGDWEHIL